MTASLFAAYVALIFIFTIVTTLALAVFMIYYIKWVMKVQKESLETMFEEEPEDDLVADQDFAINLTQPVGKNPFE